ncbi:hypothetical protein BVX94_02055 [bacterium B17]|nr:hypothetical protein BVX94_02055 [bacterium B17]
MKNTKLITLILMVATVVTGIAVAETCHYVNGVEGIKAGSLPPPGLYYRMYHAFYTADTVTDGSGAELPVGLDLDVYAFVNRLIWITDKKILGGDYGADVIVPLINTDFQLSALSLDDDQFGFGDICIEPLLLSWHGAKWDLGFGLGGYIPTGDYDVARPSSPGKDMWTGMLTLGGTIYDSPERVWSASILGRYEVHSEKGDSDVTPGDDFHFEWGIARNFNKTLDVGVTGYCQWQVESDKGSAAESTDKDQVYAIGPEVMYFLPPAKSFLSLRTQWEFEAEDRPEGNITTLTWTKIL